MAENVPAAGLGNAGPSEPPLDRAATELCRPPDLNAAHRTLTPPLNLGSANGLPYGSKAARVAICSGVVAQLVAKRVTARPSGQRSHTS